ncbi:MerR family transcriptional regulator [Leptolyngbya sp. KIOST-1]|uniref:MerR family transcriptional regulator n=1 Tax=Leptolyngbya sp. KIOST-1 TaxID=1229172 RepID=UPI00056D7F44|nr:MerR family transcriptional regulator [Leptolyngbya sp. KIOST-1]
MARRDIGLNGFTRQETLKLTQCTSSRLSYLEKVGLVIPERIGISRKPVVIFSWEQLLEIKAIKNLREDNVSLQTVRKIVEFLNQSGYDDCLKDKKLVVVDNEVFWVRSDMTDLGQHIAALTVASKTGQAGQFALIVIPALVDIVNEIWETAQNSNVIDFESFKVRAKAKPA